MQNKCNELESSWNQPSHPQSMEKLSSMKLVPGAKKVGDHWPMTAMSPMTFLPLCRILLQCRSSIPGSGRFTWERIVYPLQYSWASLVAQLVKNPPAIQETRVGKIPWREERLPTPVFWPGEFRGLYNPWGHKESDTTERLLLSHSLFHLSLPHFSGPGKVSSSLGKLHTWLHFITEQKASIVLLLLLSCFSHVLLCAIP